MNGVSGQILHYKGHTGPGTTSANEMNFGKNHGPGTGSTSRPIDLQSGCYHCAMAAPNEEGLLFNNGEIIFFLFFIYPSGQIGCMWVLGELNFPIHHVHYNWKTSHIGKL